MFYQPIPGRSLLPDSCPTHTRHKLGRLGHHLAYCHANRTTAHNAVRDILHSYCANAGVRAVTEETSVLRESDAGSLRRPDLTVEGLGENAKDLLVDVVTVDPASATSVARGHSHKKLLGATLVACANKHNKYSGYYNRSTHEFRPVAIEMTGRWGLGLTRLFHQIRAHGAASRTPLSAQRNSDNRASELKFTWWKQQLSVGFMRALARASLNLKATILRGSRPINQMGPYELAFR